MALVYFIVRNRTKRVHILGCCDSCVLGRKPQKDLGGRSDPENRILAAWASSLQIPGRGRGLRFPDIVTGSFMTRNHLSSDISRVLM